jgi:hypothetical protein
VAGLFGTTIATANAAPANCTSSPQACAVGSKQAGPTVKLDHHQQKEVGKQANKEAKGKQVVTPRDHQPPPLSTSPAQPQLALRRATLTVVRLCCAEGMMPTIVAYRFR